MLLCIFGIVEVIFIINDLQLILKQKLSVSFTLWHDLTHREVKRLNNSGSHQRKTISTLESQVLSLIINRLLSFFPKQLHLKLWKLQIVVSDKNCVQQQLNKETSCLLLRRNSRHQSITGYTCFFKRCDGNIY